jgi:hypothetical protein
MRPPVCAERGQWQREVTVRIGILGPLEVRDQAGQPVRLGGARLRALLIRLALDPGRTIAAERT